MNPNFGYNTNSFSRPRGLSSQSLRKESITAIPFGKIRNPREGDIIAVSDSDHDDSAAEYENIKAARLKRMRERERLDTEFSSIKMSSDNAVTTRAVDPAMHGRGPSNSLRSYMFSDMSFEDDEDLDLPAPPVGRTYAESFRYDTDPMDQHFPREESPGQVSNQDEVVDLEAEKQHQRILPGFLAVPIPPLNDVMAAFKGKIALKKTEMKEAQDLREQTAERIRALREELNTVKERIDAARRRYELLDDQAARA